MVEKWSLVTYGPRGVASLFDAHDRCRKVSGPTESILCAQYVDVMGGLVTCSVTCGGRGDVFLFNAHRQGRKLDGPTVCILGAKGVDAMNGQRFLCECIPIGAG